MSVLLSFVGIVNKKVRGLSWFTMVSIWIWFKENCTYCWQMFYLLKLSDHLPTLSELSIYWEWTQIWNKSKFQWVHRLVAFVIDSKIKLKPLPFILFILQFRWLTTISRNGVRISTDVRRMCWPKMFAPVLIHSRRHCHVKFWRIRNTFSPTKWNRKANLWPIKRTPDDAGYLPLWIAFESRLWRT